MHFVTMFSQLAVFVQQPNHFFDASNMHAPAEQDTAKSKNMASARL